MKSRKINLDRPQVDSKEIQAQMDFNRVLENHQVMAKPFYKSPWFFGTAGMASLGALIGGSIAFQDADVSKKEQNLVQTDAPPELVVPDNNMIAMNGGKAALSADILKQTFAYNNLIQEQTNETSNEANTTLETTTSSQNQEIEGDSEMSTPEIFVENEEEESQEETVYTPTGIEVNERDGYSRMDLHPRISGKINGSITRDELLNSDGITTKTDVDIVHFELHLIDGLGGKVFKEDGNQLNAEMKAAIDRVLVGETIYFENIQGKSSSGELVKLNPLRYVLLN